MRRYWHHRADIFQDFKISDKLKQHNQMAPHNRMIPYLFDRQLWRRKLPLFITEENSFLHNEISNRMVQRLMGLNRSFPMMCETGFGVVFNAMHQVQYPMNDTLLLHPSMVDEEALPLQKESIHLFASCLSLHWVNDLPGVLRQIAFSLKPDGLFLGAMIGGESLKELKICLDHMDQKYYGGVVNRIAPFLDAKAGGHLLQRAGFALPVSDHDHLTIYYDHVWALFKDLTALGQRNVMSDRKAPPLTEGIINELDEFYKKNFSDERGKIPVTVDVIYLSGWKPSLDQQKALKPGSASKRLSDTLGVKEQKALSCT